MLEQNDEWQLQRRYMQLEGLKTVSDNLLSPISASSRANCPFRPILVHHSLGHDPTSDRRRRTSNKRRAPDQQATSPGATSRQRRINS